LFEQLDAGLGMAPFPEIGEIETAGASADHRDAQRLPPDCRLVHLFAHDLRANVFRVCREGKPLHTLR
jgi:hypothetical protein